MIKELYIVALIIGIISCVSTTEQKDVKIIEIPFLSDSSFVEINDQNKIIFFKRIIIENYHEGVDVDEIARLTLKKTFNKHSDTIFSQTLIFYKSSKKTNIGYLEKVPKTISRYSNNHDILSSYSWDMNNINLLEKKVYINGSVSTYTNLWVKFM